MANLKAGRTTKESAAAAAGKDRAGFTDLEHLPNIGPALARDLRRIDIRRPQDLVGSDPYSMYDELCRVTGQRHDPCVLDTFIAVARFMAGDPAKPWWHYTAERKRRLARSVGAVKTGGSPAPTRRTPASKRPVPQPR